MNENNRLKMTAIHLIERENLFSRVAGSQTEYESGYWAFSETEARDFVGCKIYFHDRQTKPSFYGGIITDIRIHEGEPHKGRIVFRFEPKAECRGVRSGPDSWQFWKKIVE